jgi:tetratricopeptide (TPR) repeat protein
MYYLKGDYPRAIECYLKYLEAPSLSKGRPYFLGMVGLGDVYKDLGDFNQALVYYKVAVKTSEEYGLPSDVPLAYIRMARVLLHFNEMSDSERMCEWAYTLAKELNRPHLTREVTIHFAETMLDLGIIKRAEESLQEFSDQGGPMEDRLLEAIFKRVSGILYSRIRDNDRAARNLADSVTILEDIQIPYELGRSYMEQGLFRFQNMDIEGAIDSLQRSNGIFKGLRSVHYLNRTSGKLRELRSLSEGMK